MHFLLSFDTIYRKTCIKRPLKNIQKKNLKSHYLRVSKSVGNRKKIDFLDILPIFNFCREMNKNTYFLMLVFSRT